MSTTTIVRPEFQLIETKVDYTAQSGIKIAAGTIIARLFYPAGYVFSNPGTGKGVIYDSWKVNKGNSYNHNNKVRVVEFVATKKLVEHFGDESRTVASNMAANRIRTVKLANRLLKSQVQAVRNTPASVKTQPALRESTLIARELETFNLFNPWFTATEPVALPAPVVPIQYQLCLPATVSGNAQSTESIIITPAAIFASDWNDEELWACTVKQLKVIAKKLNLKVYGKKAEIIDIIKSSR